MAMDGSGETLDLGLSVEVEDGGLKAATSEVVTHLTAILDRSSLPSLLLPPTSTSPTWLLPYLNCLAIQIL